MKYSLRFIFLYLCLISLNTGHCQLSSKLLQQQYDEARPDDFKAIQNYMNQYFKENEDPSGKKKWQRKEWYLEPRLYPSGKIENLAVKTQEAYASYMRNNSSLSLRSPHGSWLFLGPNSFTGNGGMGRINSIDIHPTNDLIIYLTSPSGGIWKTINGGNTWSNMTTHLPQLGFADLEIDHTNPNVLYALSGDGNPIPSPGSPHSQSEVSSIGVIKSIDGGITWNLTNFNYSIGSSLAIIPTKLLMHPTNPLIQFIAANDGIYKTTDGWNSNTQVYSENVYDIEFKPGDPSLMYASRNNSIYRSTMSGDSGSWNIINDVDFTVMANSQRVELAVSPDFPTLVYAMAGNWINGSQAFYASYLDGMDDTWIIKDQTTNVIGEFATYCIGLEVNPNDYNSVFGGGSWYWHSDNEGALGSWSRIGENIVHADVHDMLYRNGVIYIACDGGLYKSTDNGLTWTDLSTGLHITEIYRISGTTSDPNLYFIGAQDNGIMRRTGGSTFQHVLVADGMTNFIDYSNSNIVYATTQNGGFTKSTDGGLNFTWLEEPGGEGAWISPYILDPVDPSRLFMGKGNAYRSESGGAKDTWENIGSPWNGTLNVLAQGVDNRNKLYASSGSKIYRSDNAITPNAGDVTWSNKSAGLPVLFITGISVDPTNSLKVFVTVSGYTSGSKVFKSTSGGDFSSWVNISGSLPNIPINCIEFHNDGSGLDKLYIGTDIGVFYRDNSIDDWIYFSDFMPSVVVNDLYLNPIAGTITAGTYGRGLWRSDLKSNCLNSVTFPSNVVQGGEIHFSYNTSITSQASIDVNPGANIHYQAGNFIDLKEGFHAPSTAQFVARIGPCPN